MIIAFSATRPDIHSRFDRRFGRCACFLIWDNVKREGRFVLNRLPDSETDAGRFAADLIAREGVKRVFSGDFGLRASDTLKSHGIEMFLLRDDGMNLMDILKLRDKQYTIKE